MTQLIIDRATLEQLVEALNEVDQHVDLKRYDTAPNEVLFDVVMAALTAGRVALANAEPAGWQPIETAPKDGTSVLAYTHDGYKYPLVCACIFDGGLWWPDSWESPGDQLSPTHWMPLPAAPKDTP